MNIILFPILFLTLWKFALPTLFSRSKKKGHFNVFGKPCIVMYSDSRKIPLNGSSILFKFSNDSLYFYINHPLQSNIKLIKQLTLISGEIIICFTFCSVPFDL